MIFFLLDTIVVVSLSTVLVYMIRMLILSLEDKE